MRTFKVLKIALRYIFLNIFESCNVKAAAQVEISFYKSIFYFVNKKLDHSPKNCNEEIE